MCQYVFLYLQSGLQQPATAHVKAWPWRYQRTKNHLVDDIELHWETGIVMFCKVGEIVQDVAPDLIGDGEFGMFGDDRVVIEPEKPCFLNRSLLWEKRSRHFFARLG